MEGQKVVSERTLEKLGEALYIRMQYKKQAEDAQKAVDYLAEEGVIND
jgi:hypothetical protein